MVDQVTIKMAQADNPWATGGGASTQSAAPAAGSAPDAGAAASNP